MRSQTCLRPHVPGHDGAVCVVRAAAVHCRVDVLSVLHRAEWQEHQCAVVQDLSEKETTTYQ